MAQGYSDDKEAVRKRLRRIEGQVRGLQRMVDEDRYCIDILEQVCGCHSSPPVGGPRAPRRPHGPLRRRRGQQPGSARPPPS